MKVQTGSETLFMLGEHYLRVNAKCNDVKHHDGFGGGFKKAHWTVKMTFKGRAASFKYSIGDGNDKYDTEMDFEGFAECIVIDMRAGETSYVDFCDEFGYSDSTTNRNVHAACMRSTEKLNRLFSFRRRDFIDRAERGNWSCLHVSAEESVKSA
jgi:hypothetical protein